MTLRVKQHLALLVDDGADIGSGVVAELARIISLCALPDGIIGKAVFLLIDQTNRTAPVSGN